MIPFTVKSKKSGTDYYLHAQTVANGKSKLHFFRKEIDATRAVDAIPEGYELTENASTGLPMLKKIAA